MLKNDFKLPQREDKEIITHYLDIIQAEAVNGLL